MTDFGKKKNKIPFCARTERETFIRFPEKKKAEEVEEEEGSRGRSSTQQRVSFNILFLPHDLRQAEK